MAQSYKVHLTTGAVITIAGVTTVEKDGSGLRLKDEDGSVIASFDDGQSKACYPAASSVETTPPTN